MDIILSVTLYLIISLPTHAASYIYTSRDIILPVYMYLLYLLNGTATVWMKSLVFIHLTQLPYNPIIFGFGRLALRCDFSETKIQPLTVPARSILTPLLRAWNGVRNTHKWYQSFEWPIQGQCQQHA